MCTVSMVHDHFQPLIPAEGTWPGQPLAGWPTGGSAIGTLGNHWTVGAPVRDVELHAKLDELLKLVADFRAASAAAQVVDRLTGQPDCVDPEKAKLEARVAALEEQLARIQAAFAQPPPPAAG